MNAAIINAALPTDAAELEGRGAGFWTVSRDGGIWDSMKGYGLSWAAGTAIWIGKPSFVSEVTVTFRPEREGAPLQTWTARA